MAVNLIILLVFVLLTIGALWLTVRAVMAKRVWVKIIGGLLAGVLTLLLGAITFLGAKGALTIYFPAQVAASDINISNTPEQIARGEYLTNLSCIGCHSAVDAEGNPTEAQPLSGGWNISEAEGFGFVGSLFVENLTPGGKLASYTDGELFRSLRYGLDKNGHRLGFMPLLPAYSLSDADTEAIIAYLRQLDPVESQGPTGDQITFLGLIVFGAEMFGVPPTPSETVTAPPAGPTAAYGKYVATYGDCLSCHGPDATGTEATSMFPAVPNPRPLVGSMSLEQFVGMMRSGVRPGGVAFDEAMPWSIASRMTDTDLEALYIYLTTPVQ